MYQLYLVIPGLPKTPNARLHWRARYRENQRWAKLVGLLVANKRPPKPLTKAELTLTRRSSSPTDYDNLVAAFKPVTDALVMAGVLADDDFETIGMPKFRWEKAPPKKGEVVVHCVGYEPQQTGEQT